MAASKSKCVSLPLLLLVAAALAGMATTAAAQPQGGRYCWNTLLDLMACTDYIVGARGDALPTPSCCASYSGVFRSNTLCLCYIVNGRFGESIHFDVNVTRALEIPTVCGQVAPPVDVCNMTGTVLPAYMPASSPSSSPLPPTAVPSAPTPAAAPTSQTPGYSSSGGSAPPTLSPPFSSGGHASLSSMALPLMLVSGIAYGVLALF